MDKAIKDKLKAYHEAKSQLASWKEEELRLRNEVIEATVGIPAGTKVRTQDWGGMKITVKSPTRLVFVKDSINEMTPEQAQWCKSNLLRESWSVDAKKYSALDNAAKLKLAGIVEERQGQATLDIVVEGK